MSAPVDVALRMVNRTGRPLLWVLLLVACGESAPEGLEWRVQFACAGDALATDQLTVRVLKGGCTGERVLYESSFGRDGGAAPKTLGEGRFGLLAVAQGEAGVVAEICEEHELPSSQPVVLTLRAPGCTAAVDAGGEEAGAMDAGDSAVGDAGMPDAAPPDAGPPPCMPPMDCRPCAKDGNTDDCPPATCTEFAHGPHSYLFCSDKQEWAGARTQCRNEGRDLVVVDDAQENAFIVSHLGGATHWIGANDRGFNGSDVIFGKCPVKMGEEGTWRWIDPLSGNDKGVNFCAASGPGQCGSVASLYVNWASDEPNNSDCECRERYHCGEGEDCAAIDSRGAWLDSACSAELPYVCESY